MLSSMTPTIVEDKNNDLFLVLGSPGGSTIITTVTQILVNSIILPLIFATIYSYIIYQAILLDEPFSDFFKLYFNLDNLYTLFATESFLLIFWLHFVAINLFLGSWMSRDAIKYNITKRLVFIPLILIYLTGPLGIVLYWFIRIFFSKKIGIHD